MVRDCTFERNYGQYGAAIAIQNGVLTVENAVFIANEVGSYGGAIWALSSTLTIRDSRFIDNSALYAGGDISASETDLSWLGSTSIGARTDWIGGGSLDLTDSVASIAGASFSAAFGPSGACLLGERTDLDLLDVLFDGCVGGSGAAVQLQGLGAGTGPIVDVRRVVFAGDSDAPTSAMSISNYSDLSIADSTFDGNLGGLIIDGSDLVGNLQIADSLFSDSLGTAVFVSSMNQVEVSRSTFRRNGGQALYVNAYGDVDVSDSAFCGNDGSFGAAVSMSGWTQDTHWNRNVFRENHGPGGTLEIVGYDSVSAELTHNDFVGNTAAGGAPIIRFERLDLMFTLNMLFDNGDAPIVSVENVDLGDVANFDNNLWYGNLGGALLGATFGPGNLLIEDPGVGRSWDGNCPGSDLVPSCASPLVADGIGAFPGPEQCPKPSSGPPETKKAGTGGRGCSTAGSPSAWLSGGSLSWVAGVLRRPRDRSRSPAQSRY